MKYDKRLIVAVLVVLPLILVGCAGVRTYRLKTDPVVTHQDTPARLVEPVERTYDPVGTVIMTIRKACREHGMFRIEHEGEQESYRCEVIND
jgi:PBP1b-binding outer membrane lipoprotein LpoB